MKYSTAVIAVIGAVKANEINIEEELRTDITLRDNAQKLHDSLAEEYEQLWGEPVGHIELSPEMQELNAKMEDLENQWNASFAKTQDTQLVQEDSETSPYLTASLATLAAAGLIGGAAYLVNQKQAFKKSEIHESLIEQEWTKHLSFDFIWYLKTTKT